MGKSTKKSDFCSAYEISVDSRASLSAHRKTFPSDDAMTPMSAGGNESENSQASEFMGV
jgi:hypothetical protein